MSKFLWIITFLFATDLMALGPGANASQKKLVSFDDLVPGTCAAGANGRYVCKKRNGSGFKNQVSAQKAKEYGYKLHGTSAPITKASTVNVDPKVEQSFIDEQRRSNDLERFARRDGLDITKCRNAVKNDSAYKFSYFNTAEKYCDSLAESFDKKQQEAKVQAASDKVLKGSKENPKSCENAHKFLEYQGDSAKWKRRAWSVLGYDAYDEATPAQLDDRIKERSEQVRKSTLIFLAKDGKSSVKCGNTEVKHCQKVTIKTSDKEAIKDFVKCSDKGYVMTQDRFEEFLGRYSKAGTKEKIDKWYADKEAAKKPAKQQQATDPAPEVETPSSASVTEPSSDRAPASVESEESEVKDEE